MSQDVEAVTQDLSGFQLELENDAKLHADAAITEENKASVKTFKEKLAAQGMTGKDLPDDSAAIRFLAHQSWNIDAALEQYTAYIKWRKDNKVDDILSTKVQQYDLIRACIPYSLHGFAKNGSPIYMEKTGRVHTWAAAQIDSNQFFWHHVRGVEEMFAKMRESSAKTGRTIDKVITIIDFTGLNLGHRHAIGLLQTATQVDLKYYPGIVGDIYVINVPFFVPGLWDMVKSFLPMSTITKIHMLGADFKEVLLKHIDADQLPEEYGGTCKCAGGCIKETPEAEVKEMLLRDSTGLLLTEQYVGAGQTFETTLEGNQGDEFVWSFDVDAGYDVEFSANLTFADDPSKPIAVKIASRCNTNKGSYTATKKCSVQFKWDNSYSYFNGKNLRYHASVRKGQ